MNNALRSCVVVLACLATLPLTFADGLSLTNGRYSGPVMTLKLTETQKKVIDHYRTCQLGQSLKMNIFTPYVFTLTPEQAVIVKRRVGYVPALFQVFETVRGFNDAGPFWNLALRYSDDEIEIPLDLLLPDKAAKSAHTDQGWKVDNPCFPQLSRSHRQ